MVNINIVRDSQDGLFNEGAYFTRTVEEAYALSYAIVGYCSDLTEDRIEHLFGSFGQTLFELNPFVCKLYKKEETGDLYRLEVWPDDKKELCDCS
jgi:hypothetical protein